MPPFATMRAIVCRRSGGPDVLEMTTRDMPKPAADEVLVRVAAAGINRADLLQREGRYPIPAGDNPIPGLEVAGHVVELGAHVEGWAVGDAVCALVEGGAYAEFSAVPAVKLLPWPTGFDAVQAAALPESFSTVWANVFQAGRLRSGETLLVHGGRGGVGSTAIQLGRALGARVIATSGSDQGCRDCRELGADHVINYRETTISDAVMSWTDGHGADVILDHIGAPALTDNLATLGMDGRLVLIGFSGGAVVETLDLTPILARRLVVTGSAMRPRSNAEKGDIARELRQRVWPLLDQGKCMPTIARTSPLSAATEAHRYMEAGGYFGKVVLTMTAE